MVILRGRSFIFNEGIIAFALVFLEELGSIGFSEVLVIVVVGGVV